MKKRILLLSAYHAQSHAYWCEWLMQHFPEYDWQLLQLPARYFNWRIRGNSLSWAFEQAERLAEDYDLLIATSMVDLSSLRGFIPRLAAIPTIVYFHENQFAYPLQDHQLSSAVEPQMVNLYTALCADQLIFNSDYNRRSFLMGVRQLLKKLPDHTPEGVVEKLAVSQVLPVPISDQLFQSKRDSGSNDRPIQLIWNHRWEYDKGPDRLFNLVTILLKDSVDFQLSVVGEKFRQMPTPLKELKRLMDEHPQHLRQWGYLPQKDDYHALLCDSDIVLSTALHDYQGIAILEAVACGCRPLLPDRLAYPDIFGQAYCYPSYETDPKLEAQGLAEAIKHVIGLKKKQCLNTPDMRAFSSRGLMDDYRRLFERTFKQSV